MLEQVYRAAWRERGYRASRFLQALRRHGGVATAKRLLERKGTSRGFEILAEKGRLDLSMEALVLRPEFTACSTRRS